MSGENGKAKSVQPGSGEMRNIPMRRSGIRIMGRLVGLVTPLLPVMLLAILLGTLGYLAPSFSPSWQDLGCCTSCWRPQAWS